MAAKKTPKSKATTPSTPAPTKSRSGTRTAAEALTAPRPPLPPADLHERRLDVHTMGPLEVVRIGWPDQGLFWSPKAAHPPRGRFDAPGGEYQVNYSALYLDGAFVEALLRQEQTILAWDDVQQRELFTLTLTRAIRVMPLFGPQLRQMGATSAVASGPYSVSRQWSLALSQWEDDGGPLDGLLYPSRHDDTQLCLALYSRSADAIALVSHEPLAHRHHDILALRRKYRFPLELPR